MHEMNKRIHWIDVSRGIAMVLVVLGHIGMKNSFTQWIYSFHMPLFFMITGLTPNLINKNCVGGVLSLLYGEAM